MNCHLTSDTFLAPSASGVLGIEPSSARMKAGDCNDQQVTDPCLACASPPPLNGWRSLIANHVANSLTWVEIMRLNHVQSDASASGPEHTLK